MGLFKRRKPDGFAHTDDFWQLVDEVDEIRQILDRRLSVPKVPPPRLADADVVDSALTDLRWHLERVETQLAQIDQRMTSISVELANQLNELASEIEHLESAAADAAGDDIDQPDVDDDAEATPMTLTKTIEELREAQIQLANEQVRYQLALRDDLAQLAERLKR